MRELNRHISMIKTRSVRVINISAVLMICLLAVFVVSGCTKRNARNAENNTSTSTEKTASGDTDQGDKTTLAVIAAIDKINDEIAVKDIDTEWIYYLNYDNSTTYTGRYGDEISPEDIYVGEVVEVGYDSTLNEVKSIKVSYDAWVYEGVTGLTYNKSEDTIHIMGEDYIYTKALVLRDETTGQRTLTEIDGLTTEAPATEATTEEATEASMANGAETGDGGANEDDKLNSDADREAAEAEKKAKVSNNLDLEDIEEIDTVTCWGYKGKICSVILNSGHGYLRLKGYSTYVGGMLSVGDVVAPVTRDMVLAVPVGQQTLEIDKDGNMGTMDLVVNQNEDQTVNLAKLTIIAAKKGILHFITDPENCTITIDGEEYNGKSNFSVEYGKHKVIVATVNYKAYNGEIYVNSAYMNVNVKLVPLDDDSESEADTSGTTTEATTAKSGTTTTEADESTTTEAVTEAALSTTESE